MYRTLATALLCALAIAPLNPVHAAVTEGAPLTLYTAPGQGNSFCSHSLVAEVPNATGTCSYGPAVAVAGQGAPPSDRYEAAGADRMTTVGKNGTAYLVFSPLLHPGVFEIQLSLTQGSAELLGGRQLCDITKDCIVGLAGPGGQGKFSELALVVSFPTIVGAFTPAMEFGGPNPSRLELAGTWGGLIPAKPPGPAALLDLPSSGDLGFYVGRGGAHCLALGFAPLASSGCGFGPGPMFYSSVDTDAWLAPRSFNFTGPVTLRLSLDQATPLNVSQPSGGSLAVRVRFIAGGHTTYKDADCPYTSLPATCIIDFNASPTQVRWRSPMTLKVEGSTQEPVLVGNGLDPKALVLHGVVWAPDPPNATATVRALAAHATPAPAVLFVILVLALAARPTRHKR